MYNLYGYNCGNNIPSYHALVPNKYTLYKLTETHFFECLISRKKTRLSIVFDEYWMHLTYWFVAI